MLLREIVGLLDSWYDPRWAEPWDKVGLVCGDPDQQVRRILFAVDPVESVVDEAVAYDADLVVVHHPLLLTPVSSVAATTAKGRVLHRLVRHGIALLTAHTNADVPEDGVNDAIARALGLQDARVLEPTDGGGIDKVVVFAPVDVAEGLRAAIAGAGAGAIGAYDSATFTARGEGRFRPLDGADPALGEVGELEVVEEVRIESVYPRPRRRAVVEALRAAHPYEEPAFDLIELAEVPGGPLTGTGPAPTRGHGRVGRLSDAMTLRDFAAHVAGAFPRTAHGVRVAGDPERSVRTVAVGAGSGESLLEQARRTGADVFVTSDLKHHRASEFLEDGGPALVDIAHWAAEWSWLPVVAWKVDEAVAAAGDTVETRVSTTVTDPWTFRG
ncbi:MAG TPA: Nif3-like dinuclear metal center hexameric protein [Marmoricola sp.]|nr:Nif3-like dinuclear metal center hexameric protein [Marmoricola sp.]